MMSRRFVALVGVGVVNSLACVTDDNDPAAVDFEPAQDCVLKDSPALALPELGTTLTYSGTDFDNAADAIAQSIPAVAQTILKDVLPTPPRCDDRRAVPHLQALAKLARTAECLAYVDGCLPDATEVFPGAGELAFFGALCADMELQRARAIQLFERATSASEAACSNYPGRVFTYANAFIGDAADILARVPGWDATTQGAALDANLYFAYGYEPDDLALMLDFTTSSLQHGDPLLKDRLFGIIANGLADGQTAGNALDFITHNLGNVQWPVDNSGLGANAWMYGAYRAVFYGGGTDDAREHARLIYSAYVPYAQPMSWGPTEDNSYTYTELYEDVCAFSLLHGADDASLRAIVGKWKDGTLSAHQAGDEAMTLGAAAGEMADLLTFAANMNELDGDMTGARDLYWRARYACPYYDRAIWGRLNLLGRLGYEQIPEYDALLTELDAVVAGVSFPASFSQYVLNSASLSEVGLTRLKYDVRFWAKYLDFLYTADQRLYVKQSFELLSETVPELAGLRDVRIEYANDGRLWDDVRGAGGNPVVVDFEEMNTVVFGNYNTSVHEMTHQFHAAAPAAVGNCVAALYAQAAASNNFPDYYAAYNEWEYFAQGVAYYSVPVSSPVGFGLTRQWLVDNDPDLYSFLQTLEAATTPLDSIVCPVS
jgi:hypothetical protein